MTPSALGPNTFPKLLLEHAGVRPGRPANREKDYGIWQSWSWAEVAAEVEAFACGLAAIGPARRQARDHRR
jgi:long-chain acyl-CoA synthetase